MPCPVPSSCLRHKSSAEAEIGSFARLAYSARAFEAIFLRDRAHPAPARRKRWRSTRRLSHVTNATSSATRLTKIVASALICGLTPRRTLEKITIGRVEEEEPAAKLVMTRSSSDKVKDRS